MLRSTRYMLALGVELPICIGSSALNAYLPINHSFEHALNGGEGLEPSGPELNLAHLGFISAEPVALPGSRLRGWVRFAPSPGRARLGQAPLRGTCTNETERRAQSAACEHFLRVRKQTL